MTRSLVRDSIALAPSYVVPGLVSLASVPILFGLLGATEYGRYALMFAIANGVPQLTTSWLEASTLRFGHGSRRILAAPLLVSGAALSFLVGCAFAAVFAGTDGGTVIATGAMTLAVSVYLVVGARLQSQLRFGRASSVASVRAIVGATSAVGAAAATHSATGAIVGMAFGFLAATLWVLPGSARLDLSARPAATGQEEDTKVARYAAASLLLALALYVLSVADRFVLSSVQTLSVVGVYAATYTVVDLIYRLGPSIFVSVIRPHVFRTSDLSGREAGTRFVVRSAAVIAWSNGLLTIAVVAILPRLGFLPVDVALVGPLSAGIAAFVIASSLGLALSASDRQWRLAAVVSVAAVANVVLNVTVDGVAGAGGAAVATLISYGLMVALNAYAIGLASWRAAGSLSLLVVGVVIIGLAAISSISGQFLPLGAAGVVGLLTAPVAWRRTRTLLSDGFGLAAP